MSAHPFFVEKCTRSYSLAVCSMNLQHLWESVNQFWKIWSCILAILLKKQLSLYSLLPSPKLTIANRSSLKRSARGRESLQLHCWFHKQPFSSPAKRIIRGILIQSSWIVPYTKMTYGFQTWDLLWTSKLAYVKKNGCRSIFLLNCKARSRTRSTNIYTHFSQTTCFLLLNMKANRGLRQA